MRAILTTVVRIYFGVGSTFGALLAASYVWGGIASASCGLGFVGYLVLWAWTLGYALLGLFIRTMLWLPSFVHWYIYGPEPSFLSWLMPGLFIRCG